MSNRQIVGRSAGKHKNAQLVMDAISQISINLNSVELFHSDRGKEFDNHLLDECLKEFGNERSLSHKGCSYDNAVAEATFKAVKIEFVSNTIFNSLEQLRLQFNHYVDWFNYNRLHSSLNYQSPIEYKMNLSPYLFGTKKVWTYQIIELLNKRFEKGIILYEFMRSRPCL